SAGIRELRLRPAGRAPAGRSRPGVPGRGAARPAREDGWSRGLEGHREGWGQVRLRLGGLAPPPSLGHRADGPALLRAPRGGKGGVDLRRGGGETAVVRENVAVKN